MGSFQSSGSFKKIVFCSVKIFSRQFVVFVSH